MEANARMNAMMNETLSISGAVLVKLFGRHQIEEDRFRKRAAPVRDLGIRRAVISSVVFMIVSLRR
jgi:ATP-binding cassette subfamily B protein